MSIHEIEEIKRSVGDVREWLKDQRFTDDDREPDSNINISIEQLNRALALMMVVEKEIERLREELTASHESHGNEVGSLTERLSLAIHERDEARREVCEWVSLSLKRTPREVEIKRGWDCFAKEEAQ